MKNILRIKVVIIIRPDKSFYIETIVPSQSITKGEMIGYLEVATKYLTNLEERFNPPLDKPNYAVSPMETLKDFCLYLVFGNTLVEDFEKGINEKNVYLIEAMFPKTPRKFWLNLQKNYDETVKRLEKENT